jgi:hypothetical protein
LFAFLNSQIFTSHPKSIPLLDSIPTLQQFPSSLNQSITRPPILHLRPHLNPDGSPLPTVHRRSPSPITPMDSNRISNNSNNRTILRITGTTGNILLHSIRLLCPIQISTPTPILLLAIIIHLKQQIHFIISRVICKFVVSLDHGPISDL